VNEPLQSIASAALRLLSDPRGLIELLLISAFFYWLLTLIQGTTAMAILRGVVIVYLGGAILGNVFGLSLLSWLLRNSLNALILILPILFAPELRRALEQVGRQGGVLRPPVAGAPTIEVVARVAQRLAERGWGALIVLERETGLGEYIATGTRLDAALSEELLLNVFFPHAPLHDGAVIVRNGRVVAAGCLLPLSDSGAGGGHLGTRHRAAIGISERTDALCVVVSEETRQISLANNGRIVRNLDEEKLRKVLQVIYRPAARRARWPTFRLVTRAFRRGEVQPHA
jgi:diadenylate cyclase